MQVLPLAVYSRTRALRRVRMIRLPSCFARHSVSANLLLLPYLFENSNEVKVQFFVQICTSLQVKSTSQCQYSVT
jgi:hypothetical protein